MPYLFGYGSLINRSSAERTLGRSLCCHEVHCATLADYIRSWTARDCVKLKKDGQVTPCDALFLDLSPQQNAQCNGVVIQVDQRELSRLDIREKGYERITVNIQLGTEQTLQAFAYMIPEVNKREHGIILRRYRQLIEDALGDYPETFARQFWANTQTCNAPLIDGDYIFDCSQQNAAAGRSFDE